MKWDLSAEFFAVAVSRRCSARGARFFLMRKPRFPRTIAEPRLPERCQVEPETDSSRFRVPTANWSYLPLGSLQFLSPGPAVGLHSAFVRATIRAVVPPCVEGTDAIRTARPRRAGAADHDHGGGIRIK
jgi:hypothetical protein